MSEYSPDAIRHLFDRIDELIPSAQMSGILGDSAHTYGYHRARNVLPASDYSVGQWPDDREGDGWAASALDVKLPAADMRTVCARLRAAFRAGDPRVSALREFGGTLDGRVTFSRDRRTGAESFGEWDDTHLWHVHLSITRRFANDLARLLPIADVMAGKAAPVVKPPTPAPADKSRVQWALPHGHYYGLITGPDRSHGGVTPAERDAVRHIQWRLQTLGYAPKTPGWADGVFEKATADAVTKWQRAHRPKFTDPARYGKVNLYDWKALFGV